MSKPRLLLRSAAVGGIICGLIVAVYLGITAIGTSVALPGLGIIVAGPLAAAALGGLIGGVIGLVLGFLVGVVIIFVRR